jgi:hypothetical protein
MFIFFPTPGYEWKDPTQEQWIQRCKEVVGRDDIPLDILDISRWNINEIVAEYYSDGNIFCLGDAVHRQVPFRSDSGLQLIIPSGILLSMGWAQTLASKTPIILHGKSNMFLISWRLLPSSNPSAKNVNQLVLE